MSKTIFYHTLHKQMWDYLANNPDKEKHNFVEMLPKEEAIKFGSSQCTACEYSIKEAMRLDNYSKKCINCPFEYPTEDWGCLNGLYEEYMKANLKYRETGDEYFRTRTIELATKIRDMPVKRGVKTR